LVSPAEPADFALKSRRLGVDAFGDRTPRAGCGKVKLD
jgi:hypothetical protein